MDRLTYKSAGVDLEKAESFVEFIKEKTRTWAFKQSFLEVLPAVFLCRATKSQYS
jgi:hypothetical protein